MIKQSAYGTEPWHLVEKRLDLDLLAQSESIFALERLESWFNSEMRLHATFAGRLWYAAGTVTNA